MQRPRRLFGIANSPVSLARPDCLLVVAALIWLTMHPCLAFAQAPVLLDNMDGAATSLRLLPGTTGSQIIHHGIDRQTYRRGTGAERLRLACPAGHSSQLAYKIPEAPAISEFRIAAQVLSNRPGVQLAALVTLPRTRNTATGQAYELLVRSATIGQGGDWEQLTLEDVPELLARVARVARVQFGGSIDERGATISQIVLLVPGGPGVADVLVDRIEIFGVISTTEIPSPSTTNAHASQQTPIRTAAIPPKHSATLRGVPQIIQWQGEPFELLAKLGFDTIGMSRLPSAQELAEAQKLKLSIVCPPPTPQQLTESGIPDELAGIVAWDLGSQLTTTDLEHVARWQRLLEQYDSISSRTSFITPQLFTREASRVSDTLILGRGMLGTKISLHEYSTWLNQRRRLARPGTEIWTSINTQYSPQLSQQMTAMKMNDENNTVVSYQQLAALSSATFSARSRGFYFRSATSLALKDNATQLRAKALELNNLRLQLAEPWLASGKLQTAARSSQSQLTALVLQVERSHILIPVNWSSTMQSLQSARGNTPTSFIVPGVSESAEAYLITLGGAQRVRKRRVTGGLRISLESFPTDAFVLLTDDPQAFSQVSRYLRRIAPRATQLRQELATLRLQDTSRVANAINDRSKPISSLLAQAQGEIQNCGRSRSSKTFDLAYRQADRAELLLEQCEQLLIAQSATAGKLSPFTSSPSFGVVSLPAQVQFQKNLNRAPVGKNLLQGGDFEDMQTLLQSGWRHKQLPIKGIATTVRLSPEAAHSGSYCLELEARSTDTTIPAPVVPASPVWITSPPLRVRAGEIIEITGVARVPEPLIGSVDGLQIIDSLGGVDMSLRIPQAPSWQPFRLIRVTPTDVDVTVSIALTGLGKAQVDDLAIRTISKLNTSQPAQAAQRSEFTSPTR
ncbi:MAG: hypothetical protein GXP26_01330 [Planctomycetes bacterium]|nr:hypothetical protein [Planctomycetota bacterium]